MEPERPQQCEDIQPWLAARALGERNEDAAALAHLHACPRCQRDLREYQLVAGALPYGAPASAPAPDLRERVIAAVEREAVTSAPATMPRPAAAPARTSRRRWPALSRAAWAVFAFAALAVALLGWNISLQRQLANQTAQVAASHQNWQTMIVLLNDSSLHWYEVSGGQARGHFWNTSEGTVGCLVAQQLPPLAPGQVYQVWLARDGAQASGGTFEEHDGNGWVLVRSDRPLSSFGTLFVTVEQAGGSAAPTGPRVLSGTLASAAPASSAEREELRRLLMRAWQRDT